jgi:hypothetical protein
LLVGPGNVFDDDAAKRLRVVAEGDSFLGKPFVGPIDLVTCRYDGVGVAAEDLAVVFGDAVVDAASLGVSGSGVCGAPVTGLSPGTVRDAWFVLKGTFSGCPACECDVDGNGSVTAGDALRVRNTVLGQDPPPTACPPCGYPPEVRGPGDPVSVVVSNIECF